MSKEHVFGVVKNIITEILPDVDPAQITIDKQLKDIGANSIDRMEIVTMSMRELEIKIPLMSFAGVSNIEGMVDVLNKNYQQ
ncbi:Polyketide biosynthesis acyl-carrier-protein AcpK [Kordia antarctica]|uniref:Polyketide biosynthesis acyl-carrier-protein AcpK n=1 Tax=Kordia antarctica TaxID=1218801 RepID=A0A7L4ZI39_9FLAO|nr:acyl carrier protein [Kordia antarctica]QHI36089.1 Polyketide biosynthesis acyl-carrier-protein AcpK [Kordia antarctica]